MKQLKTSAITTHIVGFIALVSQSTAYLGLLGSLPITSPAQAQVAITLGVQEIYDDNIYLENDILRPLPDFSDNTTEEHSGEAPQSILTSEALDGDPNDDLISNIFIGLSTDFPQIEHYAKTLLQGQVGALVFADNSDESRLTLDSTVDVEASNQILAEPYYLGLNSALRSESSNISVAEGTAASAAQTLTTTLRLGIDKQVLPTTDMKLGYTGSYHIFLGEWRFSSGDDPSLRDEGSDYHTHTATVRLRKELNPKLALGLESNIGVQLFSDVPSNQLGGATRSASDLDRTNAELALTGEYQASRQLSFRASAGINWSQFHNDPPEEQSLLVGPDGESITEVSRPAADETSFTFSGDISYVPSASSLLELGALQTVITDIRGDRVLTRSFNTNLSTNLSDNLRFLAGGTFIQYTHEDSLEDSTDRFEASTSLTYAITPNTALVLGYNYIDQSAADSNLEESLRIFIDDYTVNRVFVGVNIGLVGLPL